MSKSRVFAIAGCTAALVAFASLAHADQATKAPAGAKVMFIEPKNGDVITGPVKLKYGTVGMEIAPAGTDKPNTGHHHLLINTKLADPKVGIPADDKHKHYGKGQTEDTITLPPGTHTLQLVLGDTNHIPHNPVVQSEVITITVK